MITIVYVMLGLLEYKKSKIQLCNWVIYLLQFLIALRIILTNIFSLFTLFRAFVNKCKRRQDVSLNN